MELIEHQQQQVLEAFRCGEFDQIEIIGHADEKEFFELCLKEKILAALSKEMPCVISGRTRGNGWGIEACVKNGPQKRLMAFFSGAKSGLYSSCKRVGLRKGVAYLPGDHILQENDVRWRPIGRVGRWRLIRHDANA